MNTPTALAMSLAAEAAAGSHTWEAVLALATIGLAVVTLALTIVSAKLAKATAADAAKLANNSVDSMEHVAIEAIDHEHRTRELRRLARARHHRR